MPVFAGIPRQSGAGKSMDLRLHTGSFAHRRDGTRLLNFVAALTIKVDLSGPSQICNGAFADKSACRIDIFDAPTLPSSMPRRPAARLPPAKMPKKNAKDLGKRWRFSLLTQNDNLAQY
jgi:hypothetical protein